MSNCVDIHTDLVISTRNIDGVKLLADIAEYEETDQVQPEWGLKDPTTFYFYWYLGSGNVWLSMRGKVLTIRVGHHRSGHTWRDLKGLEHFLARYLLIKEGATLHCPCLMSDESDGFSTTYNGEVKICHQQ